MRVNTVSTVCASAGNFETYSSPLEDGKKVEQ